MLDIFHITGIGEILWDMFPDGAQFGGAPANFVCHSQALDVKSRMVSCVGNDELGRRALAFLQQHGVDTSTVAQSEDRPTGTVEIELDADGAARYEFAANVAWDALTWSEAMARAADEADIVCYGTLGQRSEVSKNTIQRFLKRTTDDCLCVFDVNLRQNFYSETLIRDSLEFANILKLNDEELPVLSSICGLSGSETAVMEQVRERYNLRLVALTRGADGAILLTEDSVSECDGFAVDLKDTVGAGDAFTAAMTLGLLLGHELDRINEHACRVAAFVCSQDGAVPKLPDDLKLEK
ncbi:MAG: carbohydrate kinase [Candidatus Poribacteria bacterium]|nr:carbohydrate kinase [Candidatus Poribacteria bacterium]MDE0504066.1 carbohydrate kinase [Candidatus Poribacteria bacterium]